MNASHLTPKPDVPVVPAPVQATKFANMHKALLGTAASALIMEASPKRIVHGDAPSPDLKPTMDLMVSRAMAPALFAATTGQFTPAPGYTPLNQRVQAYAEGRDATQEKKS